MNTKNTNYLIKTYSKLFDQVCYIECNDGWFLLIDNLCKCIQRYTDKKEQLKFTQIKEKFGSLRIYMNFTDDYIEGILDLATLLSDNICEVCGTTDNVTKNKTGYILTLCKKCRGKK